MAKLVPPAAPGVPVSDGPAKTGPAQLRWEGPASARAGASFNVSLRVTSGEQIRAAPMQLRFDPAVLESVSVRPGRYFSAEKTGSFGYRVNRSEEHTSELQSLTNLVCRLLLEKKKEKH